MIQIFRLNYSPCTLGSVLGLARARRPDRRAVCTIHQRTNINLTASNLAAARELGLNVLAISDAAVFEAVRTARARAWAAESEAAISERRA